MTTKYYELLIRMSAKFKGNSIWNKILMDKGLAKKSVGSTDMRDKVLMQIFEDHFKQADKNRKIQIKNLGKTYDNSFKATNDFNLTITPGEFVCLLGPSGCGKTTVLRMLAGFENITEGTYLMGSRTMNYAHPSERETAMVFQNYALYPFMTVYNNIAFGLKLKTNKNPIFNQRISQYIALKNPLHADIKDLKFKIKLLKNPNADLINQLEIKVKKLKVQGDKKKAQLAEAQKELVALRARTEKEKVANVKEIEKVKQEIQSKIAENKKIILNNKKAALKNTNAIKAKINKLKEEEKQYYATHSKQLPKIKSSIAKNKSIISKLEKDLNLALKNGLINIKKLVDNHKTSEAQIKEAKSKLDAKIKDIESKIADTKMLVNEDIMKVKIIKSSKRFEIIELKKQINPSKKLISDAIESIIVWKKTIPARVRTLSALAGIKDYLKRKPAALSGGQRQRVALIRAISKDAQLFLFDEPLSNLDAKLRATMRKEIRRIHDNSNATSLYVTHDQIEAMTMATKVVVMNVGYIQQVGAPADLYENPSNIFVARFIGSPTINLKRCDINGNKALIGDHAISLDFSGEKADLFKQVKVKKAIIGFRPQDVTLVTKTTKGAIHGTVVSTELIGSEKIVVVSIPGMGDIRVIASNHISFIGGEKVSIAINPKKIHLFDGETGIALTSILNDETKKAITIWKATTNQRIMNKAILDKLSNKQTMTQKAKANIVGSTTKDAKKNLLKNKISSKSKVYDDYSLIELDDDQSINS